MNAAEEIARDRGTVTLGITVGLSAEYGPPSGCMPCAATFQMAAEPAAPRAPQQRRA